MPHPTTHPDPAPATTGGTPAARRGRWRRVRPWLSGLAALAVVAVVVVEAPTVAHGLTSTFRRFDPARLPWLAVALAAEAASFVCYALVQRRLLGQGGARLSRRTMVGLAIGATGLTNLVPGGTAPASGWLVGQYRRRGVPMPLALWAVLAGGFAATVSVLLLLLVGAGIAGLLGPWGALACAVALAAGATVVAVAVRRRSPSSAGWPAPARGPLRAPAPGGARPPGWPGSAPG